MGIAFALMLLTEAAAACPRADARRLGGGALFLRPVGVLQAAPFIWLGPAVGIDPRPGIRRTGADAGVKSTAEPERRCEPIITQA